jgi:hypothetical protein
VKVGQVRKGLRRAYRVRVAPIFSRMGRRSVPQQHSAALTAGTTLVWRRDPENENSHGEAQATQRRTLATMYVCLVDNVDTVLTAPCSAAAPGSHQSDPTGARDL